MGHVRVASMGGFLTVPGGMGGGSNGAVKYEVKDSRGKAIAEGLQPVTAAGGFSLKLTLPGSDDLDLGHASVSLAYQQPQEAERNDGEPNRALSNLNHSHRFQIKEFRTPE